MLKANSHVMSVQMATTFVELIVTLKNKATCKQSPPRNQTDEMVASEMLEEARYIVQKKAVQRQPDLGKGSGFGAASRKALIII